MTISSSAQLPPSDKTLQPLDVRLLFLLHPEEIKLSDGSLGSHQVDEKTVHRIGRRFIRHQRRVLRIEKRDDRDRAAAREKTFFTPLAPFFLGNPCSFASMTAQAIAGLVKFLRSAISSNQKQRVKRRVTQEGEHRNLLVSAGEREKALQFLRNWFSDQVKDYLKICDQFFGPSDLELLMLLCSANPKCKVYILTSKKHHDQEGISSLDAEYLRQWQRISDQDPPETEIVIVGIESSGKSPIHDRWWFTKGGGLKMSNSFNSLGMTQESTISYISATEAAQLESDVDQYLIDKKKEYNGERVRYLSFTL